MGPGIHTDPTGRTTMIGGQFSDREDQRAFEIAARKREKKSEVECEMTGSYAQMGLANHIMHALHLKKKC
jgi:hypothetical protein